MSSRFISRGQYLLRVEEISEGPSPYNFETLIFVVTFKVMEIFPPYYVDSLCVGESCAWVQKISKSDILGSMVEANLRAFSKAIRLPDGSKNLTDFVGREVYCSASEVMTKDGNKFLKHFWSSTGVIVPAPEPVERPTPGLFGPRLLDVD